jgi:hypothetical protein
MVIVGVGAIVVSRLFITGTSSSPLTSGGGNDLYVRFGGLALLQSNPGPGYLSRLIRALSSRSFWYVFIWLLPLGLAGIKRLPRAWVIASIVGAAMALIMGVYRNIEGNMARPLFDVLGPMLSLSVALWLSRSLLEPRALRADTQ